MFMVKHKVMQQYIFIKNILVPFQIKVFLAIIIAFRCINIHAQDIDTIRTDINPAPTSIINDSEKRNTPAVIIIWDNNFESNNDGSYSFSIKSPISFSFFGIGWKCENINLIPGIFLIKYRTKSDESQWSEWIQTKGEITPDENTFHLYRSDIIFVNDSNLHNQCEIILVPPVNEKVSYLRADFVNMKSETFDNQTKHLRVKKDTSLKKSDNCALPAIIPRSEWCGGYADCQTPTFTPTIIHPTHVIIHHGGSPDTYSDGYAVVRSYWNYHVYSNGWDDIGYNFLVDKYGNIFQGRYNPDITIQDINGAHAGYTNGKSIGICFLGNSDVTNATDIQLSKVEELLAWWFPSRGLDPTTKDSIINQAGTFKLYLPRISGHRDVKPATECPGNNVYNLLPAISTETEKLMQTCSGIQPPENINPFQIYPNPSSGKITMKILGFTGGTIKLKLYNIYGIKLHSQTSIIADDDLEIDISKFQSGIYIVKVNANGQTYSGKISKY
jgi:hypothetical protein